MFTNETFLSTLIDDTRTGCVYSRIILFTIRCRERDTALVASLLFDVGHFDERFLILFIFYSPSGSFKFYAYFSVRYTSDGFPLGVND